MDGWCQLAVLSWYGLVPVVDMDMIIKMADMPDDDFMILIDGVMVT